MNTPEEKLVLNGETLHTKNVISLIGAWGGLIVVLTTAISGLIMTYKTANVASETKAIVVDVAKKDGKLDVIHDLVNSKSDAAAKQIDELKALIAKSGDSKLKKDALEVKGEK